MKKAEQDIYILRKDLRISYEFLKKSIFYFFWNEEDFTKEKRGDFFKENLKKALKDLKINIEKNKGEMEIIQGGIIEKEASIHISNLAVVDSKGNSTRIGRKLDEKLKCLAF